MDAGTICVVLILVMWPGDEGMKVERFKQSVALGESTASAVAALEGVPIKQIAISIHEQAIKSPVQYQRHGDYLDSLRMMGEKAEADRSLSLEEIQTVRLIIIERAREVLLFEKKSGYLDSDSDHHEFTPSMSRPDRIENVRATFRSVRSIALRLEALRVMNRFSFSQDLAFVLSQSELDKIVHDYNPTEAPDCRSDSALKQEQWSRLDRAQVALFIALTHFPTDPEAVTLLCDAVTDRQANATWTHGALATLSVFFIDAFSTSPPAIQKEICAAFAEAHLRDKCPAEASEEMKKMYQVIHDLLRDARQGSFHRLPENWRTALKREEVIELLSISRQQAVRGSCYFVTRISTKRGEHTYPNCETRLNHSSYLRTKWIARWKAKGIVIGEATAKLQELHTHMCSYLTQTIPCLDIPQSAEDKGVLIVELVLLHEECATSSVDTSFEKALEGISELLNPLNEKSLMFTLREAAFDRVFAEKYADKKTQMVDLLALERMRKNKPADLRAKSMEVYHAQCDQILLAVDKCLAPHFRKRDKYEVLEHLGFSLSDIYRVIELPNSKEK